jgi:hypothetical protein
MKKKSFNQKLNLKKVSIASLSRSKMNGINGGNAPLTDDYGYTDYMLPEGGCAQPRECNPGSVQTGCTVWC